MHQIRKSKKKLSSKNTKAKAMSYNYDVKGIPTEFKIKKINNNVVEATVTPASLEF